MFGSEEVQARCGSSGRQMVWRTGSVVELIQWDGQSTASGTLTSSMASMSHHDPEQEACTECRCRRENEESRVPDSDRVEMPRFTLVGSGVDSLLDSCVPPLGDVLVGDSSFVGRRLEVMKRPPRIS